MTMTSLVVIRASTCILVVVAAMMMMMVIMMTMMTSSSSVMGMSISRSTMPRRTTSMLSAAASQHRSCRSCRSRIRRSFSFSSSSLPSPFCLPCSSLTSRRRWTFNHHGGRLFLTSSTTASSSHLEQQPQQDMMAISKKLLNVTILDRGPYHIVVEKPPGVVCHHSDWSGSRSRSRSSSSSQQRRKRSGKGGDQPEDDEDVAAVFPMLQRTREAVGSRVNLIHRLDRGASGCLLLTYADAGSDEDDTATAKDTNVDGTTGDDTRTANTNNATAILQQAMTMKASDDVVNGRSSSNSSSSQKTYLAFVRGECIVSGRDLRDFGWFKVDRPIKNERGNLKNATTYFRWIAGQDNDNGRLAKERPRMSIVLARPITGRWHQIRKHLNGLSAPIIGDSTHGNSKTNREWRRLWNLPPERTCLHLLNLQLQVATPPPNHDDAAAAATATILPPSGKLNVSCPLLPDMQHMIHQNYILPEVIQDAKEALQQEGLNPMLLDGFYDDTTHKRHEVVTIDKPTEHQSIN